MAESFAPSTKELTKLIYETTDAHDIGYDKYILLNIADLLSQAIFHPTLYKSM